MGVLIVPFSLFLMLCIWSLGWLQRAFHLTPREGKGLTLVSLTLADQLPQAQSETSSMRHSISELPLPFSRTREQANMACSSPSPCTLGITETTYSTPKPAYPDSNIPSLKTQSKASPLLSSNFFCLLLDLSTLSVALMARHMVLWGIISTAGDSRSVSLTKPAWK